MSSTKGKFGKFPFYVMNVFATIASYMIYGTIKQHQIAHKEKSH
ncbi:hypothetical protein [Undibacterium griseum]|nr:hypothetical protein [Undibacterium griseum]